MPSEQMSPLSAFFRSFSARWFWGALLLGTVFSLMLFGRDLEIMLRWESAAREHAWLQWWAAAASRSLFSAGKLGAQDVSHALLLLVLAAWAVSLRGSIAARHPHFRAWTWYYLTCLLFFFLMNRGMKVFFGRVRPSDVLRGDLDYTPMWCIGQYELLDALSKGSFTSGHTTMAMVLLPMAFLTLGTSRFAVSFPMFVSALTWALLVGWGRVINGSHYPSDILWAVIVCIWICAYVREHLVLPHQHWVDFRTCLRHLSVPFWYGLGLVLFFVALLGIKETIFRFVWIWPVLIMPAGFGCWWCWRHAKLLRSKTT